MLKQIAILHVHIYCIEKIKTYFNATHVIYPFQQLRHNVWKDETCGDIIIVQHGYLIEIKLLQIDEDSPIT
jgi:hypothetical protein